MKRECWTGCLNFMNRAVKGMGLSLLVVIATADFSSALDTVKISSLLADPTGYNMKLVRIEGTVGQLQTNHFIGNNTKLEKCMQRFMVKDDTGTIQAVYTTICPNDSLLRNGDRVSMEARFSGVLEVRSLTKN
ncbi:MAG TPA: hypothetical protein VH593_19525 [Ktedonobacteraceae bacterium]|jgi:cytochrome c-type biogenesis protein CcmE